MVTEELYHRVQYSRCAFYPNTSLLGGKYRKVHVTGSRKDAGRSDQNLYFLLADVFYKPNRAKYLNKEAATKHANVILVQANELHNKTHILGVCAVSFISHVLVQCVTERPSACHRAHRGLIHPVT